MVSTLSFLFALLMLVASSGATPYCCNLSFDCLNNQRANTGYYKIGTKMHITDRDRCSLQGRANYCVAKWTNNAWYCASPGEFMDHVETYKLQCPGRVFPTAGKKEPCCRYEGGIQAKCDFALQKLLKTTCKK